MKIQFEEAEFEQLCPCYLLLNRELAIVKWGSGFNAYKHSFKANDPADHHFSFTASPLQNLITQAQSTQKKVSIDGLMLSSASAYFKGLLWIENAGDTVFVALVPSTATCLAEKQIHEIPVPYFLKKEQNIQKHFFIDNFCKIKI